MSRAATILPFFLAGFSTYAYLMAVMEAPSLRSSFKEWRRRERYRRGECGCAICKGER